jgi:Dolichyl-phosphate-mannose-protein mannosyltransferase
MVRAANDRAWLFGLIAVVLTIRVAVMVAMPQPLVSDFLSYFEMARTFAAGGPMRDVYGSQAFYSPGYPLLLGSLFAVTGSSVPVALGVNLGLAALTGWLIFRLATVLTNDRIVPFVAVAAYAVWLPGIVTSASLAKENLSVPLLLWFLLSTLAVARGERVGRASIMAGLCFGAGLLAGASTLFVIAAFTFALWQLWQRDGLREATRVGCAFGLAAALVLGPWLFHTSQLFGRPLLTTNSGFNLYIGNNPAATGSFVSIADTPAGPEWQEMRARLGEAGSADALRHMAVQYALTNPVRTAELAGIKMARFWMPNIPQAAADWQGADLVGRWIDAVQHILLLALGVFGAWTLRRHPLAPVLGLTVASFWAIHAAAVVMYRYRDPVMPIVIVFAAVGFVTLFRRKAAR